MHIRPFEPRDTSRLYEICLRTGAAGSDASDVHDDPRLLGEVYVGPYLAIEPDLAFVLVDEPVRGQPGELSGAVVGYVLGAGDTAAFEATARRRWWPRLQARHPLGVDRSSADQALVRHIHAPPRTDPALLVDHPAHLHVDLLPRAQGRGMGRRLVEHLLARLLADGVDGVHLGVARDNSTAIGFYDRLGFVVLREDDDALVMGRSTAPDPGPGGSST